VITPPGGQGNALKIKRAVFFISTAVRARRGGPSFGGRATTTQLGQKISGIRFLVGGRVHGHRGGGDPARIVFSVRWAGTTGGKKKDSIRRKGPHFSGGQALWGPGGRAEKKTGWRTRPKGKKKGTAARWGGGPAAIRGETRAWENFWGGNVGGAVLFRGGNPPFPKTWGGGNYWAVPGK